MQQKNDNSKKPIWSWILTVCLFFVIIVGYSYIETIKEKNAIELERITSEGRINSEILKYRADFINDCTKKYEAMREEFTSKGIDYGLVTEKFAQERCQRGDYFDIDSIWYCKNEKNRIHGEESYVNSCVEFRLQQLGI